MKSPSDYYDIDSFSFLTRYRNEHWWFKSRKAIILFIFQKYTSVYKCNSFLELGCGLGDVVGMLKNKFSGINMTGIDIYPNAIVCASKSFQSVNFVVDDIMNCSLSLDFSSVGAFDVIEHIHNDLEFLERIFSIIHGNGLLFLTVPQHSWLWSPVDDYSCHKRRYSYKQLVSKVEAAGFYVLDSGSFVSLLLPLMIVSRFLIKYSGKEYNPESELRINPVINLICYFVMLFELNMLRVGVNLPFGGSRYLVAIKRPC